MITPLKSEWYLGTNSDVTYVVCTLRDYQDIRLLTLHRFIEATVTQIPRMVPDGFDLDSYIQQGHVDFLLGETIELELLINDEVAIHLHESKLHPSRKSLDCKRTIIDFKHRFKIPVNYAGGCSALQIKLRW